MLGWFCEVMDLETKNLPDYYTILFNGATDAIDAIDQQNYGFARSLLVKAQQAAEESYIETEE